MSAAVDMVPRRFRIAARDQDTRDTFTLHLAPLDGGIAAARPGQFNMLYVFGAGEIAISVSGARDGHVLHTTREVGLVTRALGELPAGATIGVRGPFGTPWPLDAAQGRDVVFVAGGIGLAPLRAAIEAVLAAPGRYGRKVLFLGARTPDDILYGADLEGYAARGLDVHVIVDRATGAWTGPVGVVTKLIDQGGFSGANATAFVCGPEVMMRFAATALRRQGLTEADIYLSMERNMKCATGFCGHCQWGPNFVCRDGPVFRFDRIGPLLQLSEI